MATKKERREQARRERLEAEAAEAATAKRRRRVQIGALIAFAVVVLVAVVVIVQSGGDSESAGGTATADQFASIPQDGTVLGDPEAPYTMTEFADLQCPFCKQFDEDVLPTLVDDYVRAGELKLDFQPLTFIGPDSEEAARMALALGEQGKLWQFVDLFYRNQEAENSNYVDDDFLRGLVEQIPGADADQAFADRGSDEVTAALGEAQSLAGELAIQSTPSFALARGDGEPEVLEIDTLDPAAFSAALDEQLGGGGG